MQIGAVIVAAGMSSRMGDFKPMLNIGSISIAQRVVATFHQAGVSKIVMVTGYNAVMLYTEGGGSKTLTLSEAGIDDRDFSDRNLLHGSDTDTETTGGAPYYKLTYGSQEDHESIFGWYWGAEDGDAFTCPAHKAWLALGTSNARAFIALPDEDTEWIKSLTPDPSPKGEGSIYTLNGVKLDKMPTRKGIYIRNGRKVVIK